MTIPARLKLLATSELHWNATRQMVVSSRSFHLCSAMCGSGLLAMVVVAQNQQRGKLSLVKAPMLVA